MPMTIDELRARKRELQAMKKAEEELQAAGKGDNFNLFMIKEELMDVNAQLRALMPGHRIGARRKAAGEWAPDRQQYIDWERQNNSLDEELDESHRAMLQAVTRGLEVLTPRQREALTLYQSGVKMAEIASSLGVNQSTVSRTVGRAKKTLREEAERALKEQELSSRTCIDLSDPATAKVVLSALTPKQAVNLYLYYSEWLSLREIAQLTGTDRSSVHRTLQRALRNIGAVTGYQEVVLENMDSLDELAYSMYCEIQGIDCVVPQEMRPLQADSIALMLDAIPAEYKAAESKCVLDEKLDGRLYVSDLPNITMKSSSNTTDGLDLTVSLSKPANNSKTRHGKLLTALLERGKKEAANGHKIYTWLTQVFTKLTDKTQRWAVKWWRRMHSRKDSGSSESGGG